MSDSNVPSGGQPPESPDAQPSVPTPETPPVPSEASQGPINPPGGPGGYAPPPPPPGGGMPPPPPPGFQQQPGYAVYPGGPGTYANWGQRALGFIIDNLAAIVVYLVIWIIASILSSPGEGLWTFLVFIAAIAQIVWIAWNRWIVGGRTGQSLGRRVIGTRLVAEATGQPIGTGPSFIRDVAHIIDSLICYIGWLFPLWDLKRQTIADKIMSTVVIPGEKEPLGAAIQTMRSQ